MSNIRRAAPVNGSLSGAGYWKGGVVLGVCDDAVLIRSGGQFTVTSTGATVNGIQLS